MILSNSLFAQHLWRDIQTQTDICTHRKTLQHIGQSDIKVRSQWWVLNCIQTDGVRFSIAVQFCLNHKLFSYFVLKVVK